MIKDVYFNKDILKNELSLKDRRKKAAILKRRNRRPFLNIRGGAYSIYVGDVASIFFLKKYDIYQFEGIIMGIKFGLNNINCTLCLRNVMMGVGIEYKVSYYSNRLYYMHLFDYKRKKFIYKRAKLFYIRNKKNKASRIKTYAYKNI